MSCRDSSVRGTSKLTDSTTVIRERFTRLAHCHCCHAREMFRGMLRCQGFIYWYMCARNVLHATGSILNFEVNGSKWEFWEPCHQQGVITWEDKRAMDRTTTLPRQPRTALCCCRLFQRNYSRCPLHSQVGPCLHDHGSENTWNLMNKLETDS